VMVVNKALSGSTSVNVRITNARPRGPAQVWQLGAGNAITRLTDVPLSGNVAATTVPAPSITLFVIPVDRTGLGKP